MRALTRTLTIAILGAVLMVAAVVPAAGTTSAGYAYPSDIKAAFVKGCVKGGASRAACKCVIRKLERRYSLKQFTRIVKRAADSGDFPAAVDKIIANCARKYE
jgi:hypothetical protein